MSAFSDLRTIPPTVIWDGVLGRVIAGEQATFAVIELEPGTVVPEHAHVNEQLGVLISGSVRFRVGDEERELESGATWQIPADVPHEVTAGPEGAVVAEVFAPARADWGALARLEPTAPVWPVRDGRL